MSVKSILSAVSSGVAMLDNTNGLPPGASSEPGVFPNAPNADADAKRGEQQMRAQSSRSQIEARYAQQQEHPQQDKDKLKPKPGERVVTMRGKKVVKTETVPYPQRRTGAMRPRPGERVVTMTPSGRILRTEIVPRQPVKLTLAAYARQADKLIEAAGGDARERNRAITGAYAAMYVQNPEAFQWLGAAAYASGQVGFLMDVVDAVNAGADGAAMPPNTPINGAARDVVKQNAGAVKKMMANGNIAIYRNIYPVSLAYRQGGIQELRRLGTELRASNRQEYERNFKPLLDAYEQTDKGVKLNQRKAGAGDMVITDGTNTIIEFEQRVIVQPLFDKNPKLVYAMGLLAFGDLDANDTEIDWQTFSAFQRHHLLNNFGNPDERNDWIRNEVFVYWDKQRAEQPDKVRGQMYQMILDGQASGGRY